MKPPDLGRNIVGVAVVDEDDSVCRSFSRLLRQARLQARNAEPMRARKRQILIARALGNLNSCN